MKIDFEWVDCRTMFSNGTEFELFEYHCEKCSKYRNGKCRIFNKIIQAMFLGESAFPFDDLLELSNGIGGKKCKSFTDEPIKRKPYHKKQIYGQISFI